MAEGRRAWEGVSKDGELSYARECDFRRGRELAPRKPRGEICVRPVSRGLKRNLAWIESPGEGRVAANESNCT